MVSTLFQQHNYYLEGDGLAFVSLAHAIAIESYLNTEAKAQKHDAGNVLLYTISWLHKQKSALPQVSDSTGTISVEFHDTARAFKAARLCCPVKVKELDPNESASVQEMEQFGVFT